MKGLVDLIYGTGRIRRNYEKTNPTAKVIAADASKGIVTNKNQDIVRGADWVRSQRAVVMLTDSEIICGKWIIPIEQIQSAQLLKFSSFLGDGVVLKIETVDKKNYQFGMQLNQEWTKQDVLPLTLEKAKVKYSTFSIVVRVIAAIFLIYWAYQRFS